MSAGSYRPCEVTMDFADAEYRFKLPLKRIAELEDKCGAPVGTIWKRVCITGEYAAYDLVQTVRLGLIGGGMDPIEAKKLIDRYCDEWPLAIWHGHAIAILGVCIEGYQGTDDNPGDSDGKKPEAGTENQNSSTSPPATPQD